MIFVACSTNITSSRSDWDNESTTQVTPAGSRLLLKINIQTQVKTI